MAEIITEPFNKNSSLYATEVRQPYRFDNNKNDSFSIIVVAIV